jgi:hypothetical protein
MAAANMNEERKVSDIAARLIVTFRSSNGWRTTSNTHRGSILASPSPTCECVRRAGEHVKRGSSGRWW